MTKKEDEALLREAEAFSDEVQGALEGLLEDEIREAWTRNTAIWLVTVAGAFALNLLLLVLVAGG